MSHDKISFFVPTHEVAATNFPRHSSEYWNWVGSRGEIDAWGPYDWTLQTYLHLQEAGAPCALAHSLPDHGVVVAHRDFFADDLRPGPDVLLACIVADRQEPGLTGRHPFAQLCVVQNPRDNMLVNPDPLWPATYIPFWPQPGLLARDDSRGDTFENISFFGWPQNLADQLQESRWSSRVAELGLHWRVMPRWQWHDYREVDAVVAVRSFAGRDFGYKPATKLFNAWHAGVPAVMGRESAYLAEREHELDYLEAATFEGAVDALRTLRNDPALRRAMVAHGKQRAFETRPARMVERWMGMLDDVAIPAWNDWRSRSPAEQEGFLEKRVTMAERNP